jgi:hypothetical protein
VAAICYQVGWIDCQALTGEEIYALLVLDITMLKSFKFKFVLVWHRTCERIEATQQTEYSGG